VRTRIKICGLTREADLQAAAQAGADAVGLVFYPRSKRFVATERAAQLSRAAPAWVTVTALFVNADPGCVREIIDAVQPHLLQFHGDETPQECERYGRPYMRAFRVGGPGLDSPQALARACAPYAGAAAWLFDSHSPGYGGSGLAFDHTLLSAVAEQGRPLVLSGGLGPDNVGAAVRALRPWGVDVSSGVEESPGIKSAARIQAFVQAVAGADAQAA